MSCRIEQGKVTKTESPQTQKKWLSSSLKRGWKNIGKLYYSEGGVYCLRIKRSLPKEHQIAVKMTSLEKMLEKF